MQRRRRPFFIPRWRRSTAKQVGALHEALQDDTEATRLKAGEILRSLVKEIILTPEAGELKIDVRGDLAGILAISPRKQKPRPLGPGFRNSRVVAGIGFEPMTFRL